jgi:hypothetical protein
MGVGKAAPDRDDGATTLHRVYVAVPAPGHDLQPPGAPPRDRDGA